MKTIVDCTNFWSPTGGGVRRYYLEKLADYADDPEFRLIFVMHDSRSWQEQLASNITVEHLRVPRMHPFSDYRLLYHWRRLVVIFTRYRPDLVEIGSPYLMPLLANRGLDLAGLGGCLRVGFWHADYPETYIGRFSERLLPGLSRLTKPLAWNHARWLFNQLDATFCSSRAAIARMQTHGLKRVVFLPLGVDAELYHPRRRSESFRRSILGEHRKGGKIIFFPHRFRGEKGIKELFTAYDLLCRSLSDPPRLVLAGKGPALNRVRQEAARRPERIRYLGFIDSKEEMAMLHASSDLGLALSSGETFGLSMIESMSSGCPQIGSPLGEAGEHLRRSGAGVTVDTTDPAALAEAIAALLQRPDLLELGKKARAYASQLSWQNCFQQQRHWYRCCLTAGRGATGPVIDRAQRNGSNEPPH